MKFKAFLLLLAIPTISNSMDKFTLIGAGTELNLKTLAGSLISWVLTVTGHEFGHALQPLGTLVASWLTVLVSHEAGHAVAGKLLFNNSINIHLGPDPTFSTTDKIVASLGPIHFHGLPFFGAVSVPILSAKSRRQAIINELKMSAFDAAGPIAGTIGGLFLDRLMAIGGMPNRIPNIISLLNLLNLLPVAYKGFASDGYGIWQSIKHIKYLLTARKTIYDIA